MFEESILSFISFHFESGGEEQLHAARHSTDLALEVLIPKTNRSVRKTSQAKQRTRDRTGTLGSVGYP